MYVLTEYGLYKTQLYSMVGLKKLNSPPGGWNLLLTSVRASSSITSPSALKTRKTKKVIFESFDIPPRDPRSRLEDSDGLLDNIEATLRVRYANTKISNNSNAVARQPSCPFAARILAFDFFLAPFFSISVQRKFATRILDWASPSGLVFQRGLYNIMKICR